jgi:hypothetical protein
MNPIAIVAAGQRAEAAYIVDPAAAQTAFEQLGMKFLGQYQDSTHQGVVSQGKNGQYYVTITGTRWSEGFGADLLSDIWLAPVKAPKGGVVPAGVYCGMKDFWAWVYTKIPAGSPVNIEGHSLGAERALLAPCFIDPSLIGDLYAFEPPQCGDQAFWDAYRQDLKNAVVTVNGQDIWFNWPPHQGYVHDANMQILWIMSITSQWILPSQYRAGSNAGDHDISAINERLQYLMANAKFPQLAA